MFPLFLASLKKSVVVTLPIFFHLYVGIVTSKKKSFKNKFKNLHVVKLYPKGDTTHIHGGSSIVNKIFL